LETHKTAITEFFKVLQDEICIALENADGKAKFSQDNWEREGGGGGRSRTIVNGNVIEKGGVGYSAVHGQTPEKILNALGLEKSDFYATGVSLVIHPESPMVPIVHMNVRYFEMSNGTWWFGGGIDLTPHYVDEADALYFHKKLKDVCDDFDKEYYPKFKTWADNYFYIKHREETRGVGGIFFDRLNESSGATKEQLFKFVQNVGRSFAPIYTHFMNKNKALTYGEEEKNWQMLRRSRYVEFNLVLDAGTKFGLDTNGRTESILMSMPPMAKWVYNYQPQNEREIKTLSYLKKDINWV
jgi:coproporphyrinogen III oxidase